MIGLVKMSLKLDTTILWIVPIMVIGTIIVLILVQTGQKVGAEQTFIIHHFFENVLHVQVHFNKIR